MRSFGPLALLAAALTVGGHGCNCGRSSKAEARKANTKVPAPAVPKAAPAAPAAASGPGGCTPTKGGTPSSARSLTDVAYVTGGGAHASHRLDLKIPDGPGPYPALVWIHGGAWRKGDKRQCPVCYEAERGYVVASINYRLSGEAHFPAQIQDAKAAIRFLRAHAATYKIDPSRIAAAGDSAGGHLVNLLGTSGGVAAFDDARLGNASVSSRIAAAAPFYGPTDLGQMTRQARSGGCGSGADHDRANSPESQLLGCALASCPDKVRTANPIAYVTKDDPPFLIQHGSKDCTVPPAQSKALHEALQAAGVSSQINIEQGHGHEGAPFRRDMLDGFLDKNLACRAK